MDDIKNTVVLSLWLSLAMENLYEPSFETTEKYLTEVGGSRRIFRALAKTPEGLEMGKRIFEKNRSKYHFVTSNSIAAILGL